MQLFTIASAWKTWPDPAQKWAYPFSTMYSILNTVPRPKPITRSLLFERFFELMFHCGQQRHAGV